MNGIRSLNAGAYANLPQQDIRLSGDHRPTYTQRRRDQMAYGGIAGLDGRKRYGLGSWFQEKIMDPVKDFITNEIKDSPVGAALVGGALLNQFGLPSIPGMGKIGLEQGMGQNWLGELLGGVMPGGAQFNTVIGDKLPFMYNETLSNNPVGGLDQLAKDIITQSGGTYEQNPWGISSADFLGTDWRLGDPITKEVLSNATGTLKDYLTKQVQQEAMKKLTGTTGGTTTGGTTTGTDASGRYPINWRGPLTIGTGIGLADYLTRSDDTMPAQLAIDPSRFATAAAAKADPNLRFKPQEAYTLKDGGRIGYQNGGNGDHPLHDDYWEEFDPDRDQLMASNDANTRLLESLYEQFLEMGFSPKDAARKAQEAFDEMSKAPGRDRVMAQEGGLMNLGGMEKDYRQEGGFVPIGAKEKADDVPARLSKNEFVFTADAVRSAGGGDIDKGAAVMENLMENLEAGGKVSEDSQGLEGAQAMFANTQRLQNRII